MIFPPKIIFEDEDILIIDKPPNLVVDRSETQKEETLEDWLADHSLKVKLDRMGIVHRLDKDTSGLLAVGKTQQAFDNLQAQFRERKTKKEYLALVHGLVEKGGRVEGAIERNPRNREKFAVLPTGKEAVTEYEPMERLQLAGNRLQDIFSDYNKIQMRRLGTLHYSLFTLVACRPLTGRTHQIRVHLKYIAHPIVADEKYVGRKMYRLDRRWCPRQFLHAKRLGFYHPRSRKWVEFESPLPADLKKSLGYLTEYGL